MAKKKIAETENIKAAPVLRSQSGGGEDPAPTQTETRTYQIMDPWKDRSVVNLVDVKSVDGEITDVKVNGEPAGGGDFTIINLNLTNNTGQSKQIQLPRIVETGTTGPLLSMITLQANSGDNYKIPIYKGAQRFSVNSSWTVNIQGNAEQISTTVVNIWGDAEITIS